ncbi:MAG: hypothetical protein AAF824_06450 [Bacteroidota bacterium]
MNSFHLYFRTLLTQVVSTIFCLSFLLTIPSCGDIVPVWRGEIILSDYTLYYSDLPREFEIEITDQNAGQELRLEMALTYYTGLGRNEIPIYMVLEDAKTNVQEFQTNIPIKSSGAWQGVPDENEIDYTITHTAIPSLTLEEGTYSLKIYANDDKEEKIYGIVRIAARLYNREVPQD